MQEIKCTALCVGAMDYKDNDRLITLYAFGQGRITANCRGVKKAKAKLRYASEVLTLGTYYLGHANGYYTVIGCDMIDSFYDIRLDIDKLYPALAALEVLDKFSGDGEVADRLGARVLEYLKELCYGVEVNIRLGYISFALDVLSIIGYTPTLNGCAVCGAQSGSRLYFSCEHGGIVYDCCNDEYAEELTLEEYCALRDMSMKRAVSLSLEGQRKLIRVLIKHISGILSRKLRAGDEYVKFLA